MNIITVNLITIFIKSFYYYIGNKNKMLKIK